MNGHNSSKCIEKIATCCKCKHEYKVTFYSSDGKVFDSVMPIGCPKCFNESFTTRFDVAPDSKWIGTYGTNG